MVQQHDVQNETHYITLPSHPFLSAIAGPWVGVVMGYVIESFRESAEIVQIVM